MDNTDKLYEIINRFDSIELKEVDQVKLMNRTDTKYWFHIDILPKVFELIHKKYFVLKINGISILPYTTTYYDSSENSMYIAHHNGKLNRFKIRTRSYLSTNLSFLEIKFKNNKNRTIKKRIKITDESADFSDQGKKFISENTLFKSDDLRPVLMNKFDRITMVNKDFNERCTIDLNIHYKNESNKSNLRNFAIIEIKADGKNRNSSLGHALKELKIKPSRFSKYCIGMLQLYEGLKHNRFKSKILNINKISL
ncbi:MAG: polyphosphate polymerase domain-containing protein [Bacteroidales bacterium]|nr:polyphosphate polymerase domain-containing protein [Bacteroidales bacterium]